MTYNIMKVMGFVFCFFGLATFAETISIPVNVGAVSALISDGGEVSFSSESGEMDWLSQGGEPNVPWKHMRILLPPNADLSSLSSVLIGAEWVSVEGNAVLPAAIPAIQTYDEDQNLIPVWPKDKTIEAGRDVAIYGADTIWPQSSVSILGKGTLQGWKILEVSVPLARYNPVAEQLTLLVQAELTISFNTTMITEMPDQASAKQVRDLVVNFNEMTSAYLSKNLPKNKYPTGNLGYLIAVTKDIQAASTKLDAFIAHKQAMGFNVTVINEDDIGAVPADVGQPASIKFRAWLQANYQTLDLRYVLIIAEPRRGRSNSYFPYVYGKGMVANSTDHFYAELTCDWDLDQDGILGENDTPKEWERYYELAVGRIPHYGVMTDTDSILQKTIHYETDTTDLSWRKTAYQGMAPMNDGGIIGSRFNWTEMTTRNVFEPNGFESFRNYRRGKLYSPEEWCQANRFYFPAEFSENEGFVDVWSTNKFGYVVMKSHGTGGLISRISDLKKLDNLHPAVLYMGGCGNASPENVNNATYSLLRDGAVTTVGATGSGAESIHHWLNAGGESGMVYQYSIDVVERNLTTGEALCRMKEDIPNPWFSNWMRFMLHGDPSILLNPPDSLPEFRGEPTSRLYAVRYLDSPLPALPSETYTLVNDSSSSIDWTANKSATWFDLSVTSGTIPAYGTATLTASMNTAVESFGIGKKMAHFTVTDTTHGRSWERRVEFDYKIAQAFRHNRYTRAPLERDYVSSIRALKDDNQSTFWTMWNASGNPDELDEVRLDLRRNHEINGFGYLAPVSENGRIADYEFYVSQDGENWGVPLVTGTFNDSPDLQKVFFDAVPARYTRLVALTAFRGELVKQVAEFLIYHRMLDRGVQWQYYPAVWGSGIAAVTGDSQYPLDPFVNEVRPTFEGDVNRFNSDGNRYDGYLIPPITGDYTFWITASSYAELYLSSDASTNNLLKIAEITSATNVREWTKDPEQHSVTISLVEGVPYAMRCLHRTGGAVDHLSVAWDGPGFSRQNIAIPFLSFRQPTVSPSAPVVNGATFTVSESANVGDLLGTVVATDADAGDKLSYYITDGNEENRFLLNVDTGDVSLNALLDYETKTNYSVMVAVVDISGRNRIAVLDIPVTDVVNETHNDAPSISLVSPASKLVRVALGTKLLLSTTATDDASPAGSILSTTWTTVHGSAVVFDSANQASTSVSFLSAGSYMLRATASDGEKTSYIELQVEVGGTLGDSLVLPSNGLLLHLPFNETSGLTGLDITGNGHDALLETELWDSTGGVFGGALQINQQSETTIPNYTDISGCNVPKRTVSMWFKIRNLASGAAPLYEEGWNQRGYAILVDGDTLCFCGTGLWGFSYLVSDELEAGRWYHVAMVFDGGSEPVWNGMSAYLDGKKISEGPCSYCNVGGQAIAVGCDSNGMVYSPVEGATGIFDGSIDEFAMYNQALTVSEVAKIGCILSSVVNAGSDQMVDSLSISLAGQVTDDPYAFATSTPAWSFVSGPAGVTFADASNPSTTVTFASTGAYVLRLSASDGTVTTFDDVKVNVVDNVAANQAPVASDSSFSIAENSALGVSVGTVSVTDPDNNILAYSITAGNSDGCFSINPATGEISVAGAIDYETTSSFSLTVSVSDFDKSDTATITIAVNDMLNDDSDGDGLIDDWEITHFGSTSAQDGVGDPDGDGANNQLEQDAGTDPNNAADYPVLYAGLRAWWKLDDASGNIAVDSSGYEANGTLTGPSWNANGYRAGALEFDGVDDFLHCGTGASLSGQTDLTVAAWVKTTSTASGVILQQRGDGKYDGEYQLFLNANGTVRFMLYGNREYQYQFGTTQTVNDGAWHFIVAVRDGLNGYIYIDGNATPAASATGPRIYDLDAAIPVIIGKDQLVNDKLFNGLIDDVRIYDRALSTSVLSTLYTTTGNPSPVAWDTSYSIVENQAVGSVLGTIYASDLDDTLSYAITAGNSAGVFAIDSATGEITVAASIDYETTSSYLLTVTVSDTASQTDTASVSITVTDLVNDDSDADGLTDEWEIIHFGSVAAQTGIDDFDGDSFSNQREEIWGSDPTDAAQPGALYVGLRAWWKLDDTSGSTAVDSSGNGRDAINANGVLMGQSGQVGRGYLLDGVDDYSEVVAPSLFGSSSLTITAWIRPSNLSSIYTIVSSEYSVYFQTSGTKLRMLTYPRIERLSANILTLDEWQFVAVTFAAGNVADGCSFYRNGQLVSQESSTSYDANTQSIFLGKSHWNQYFEGGLDEIRFYDRVLTDAEIGALYQQNAGIYYQWKGTHFTAAELANPAISGDAADVDADQLSTLVEYALGLDPKTHSGSLAGCAIELDGSNGWKVEFNRHASHSDIDLVLEWSDELNPANWQPVAQSIAGGAVQALNGATLVSETGSEPTVVELNVPSTVPHGFIRWKVERR